MYLPTPWASWPTQTRVGTCAHLPIHNSSSSPTHPRERHPHTPTQQCTCTLHTRVAQALVAPSSSSPSHKPLLMIPTLLPFSPQVVQQHCLPHDCAYMHAPSHLLPAFLNCPQLPGRAYRLGPAHVPFHGGQLVQGHTHSPPSHRLIPHPCGRSI
jgi:hypothetical protein